MTTESFTNTVIIKEDGIACILEVLQKGESFTYERSESTITMGDPKDVDLEKFFNRNKEQIL